MLASLEKTPTTPAMDEKALKVVDLNRQLSTQNVGEIHERVCREMPVPAAFVEKLVAFHFGQLTLTVENLTQYYLFLETRFRKFAHQLHAFQSLGVEDREILLTTNAPFYFQLYLSRYINANDGLSQVRALLGKDIPSDLADCDRFLTVSFRYFAAALVLFVDKTAMELYQDRANVLKNVTVLDDDCKLGHLAGCLVFYKEPSCGHGTFDCPAEITRAYEWALRSAASNFEAKSYWSSLSNILANVGKLKHLVHFYSSQANIRENVSSIDILSSPDSLFEEDIILDTYSDGIALTSLPDPDTARAEESFWMSRQLKMCDARMRDTVNLGDDYLHEVAMLFLLHDDAPLSNKFFVAAFKTCVKRSHLLLQIHHEFSDLLLSSGNVANVMFRQQLEANVTCAAAFAFAVIFDEMSTSKVYQGLERVMGDIDQQSWNDQYAMLVPSESMQHMISVEPQTNLSFLGLPNGLLQTYANLVTCLKESLGSNLPKDVVILIQLCMLWKVSHNLNTRDSLHQSPVVQAASLADRYLFHLTDRLEQSGVPTAVIHQLILSMPFQSFLPTTASYQNTT